MKNLLWVEDAVIDHILDEYSWWRSEG